VIKVSPCDEYQFWVLCCVDYAHQNSPSLHKHTENFSENCAVRPTAKTARQNLVLEFFGHVNVGIGPQVEYECWRSQNFALAEQKREFLLLKA
jgi:hypothetical protein